MGNLTFSNSITLATDSQISMKSNDSNYPKLNCMDLWHRKRSVRASYASANVWFMKFDFGSAATLEGIFINDVNFDKVQIQGNAADAWGDPGYDSGSLEITKDEIVNRYKIYHAITSFNYRWLRIVIPSGTIEVDTLINKWSTGTVCIIPNSTILARNMSYPYKRWANTPYSDILLGHGGTERVSFGDDLGWKGRISFNKRHESEESELWTLNSIGISQPLVLFENLNNTSKAYLCLKDNSYQGDLRSYGIVQGNTIQFKEII